MLYPADFELKIGFDRIRELVKTHCQGPLGVQLADRIGFRSDHDTILLLVEQVWEMKQIFIEGLLFPAPEYADMNNEFRRLRTEGTFIEPVMLFDLHASLSSIADCLKFFKVRGRERFIRLSALAGAIRFDSSIMDHIDAIMDEKGLIRDSASPLLGKIRKDIVSHQHMIDKRIHATLQKAKKEGWVGDEIAVTIRNGRAVIPVPATHKRKISGLIHDESSTGQTVFIEPTEIFDINNEIRDLENAERREIIRILTEFTDYLRPHLDLLRDAFFILAEMDLIRAKALTAIELGADKPQIRPEPLMSWRKAVHPLLFLVHQRQNREVVPLYLDLDEHNRILVISGPNAGGKSICLKTAGLLQYMIQCGLLVPMAPDSQVGLFHQIFIDIGDEQSIDNDLSTYSSHLLNIKYLVEHSDSQTLFLIDEFGTGTEPQLGGAIAEATLEVLNEKKAWGIVTTHYANLKLLAGTMDGIVNGAMLFDQAKMQPLYRLKIGNPGSSYALEIAEKIGFPEDILEVAALKTGKPQLDFDQQLQQLELEKEEITRKQTEFRIADEFLAEIIQKYQNLSDDLERRRSDILSEAKEKARNILNESNRLIEQTIREIREHQAEKEVTRQARDRIERMKKELGAGSKMQKGKEGMREPDKKEELQKKERKSEKEGWRPVGDGLKKGDTVRIKGQQAPGEVLEVKGGEALIAFGMMKVKVSADRLEMLDKKLKELTNLKPARSFESISSQIHARMAAFRLTIDVRGKRAEEALNEVKKYIDEAILLNIPEVTIVHGKGDGILLQVIRDFLKGIPQVIRYSDEHIERGGHGATIVKFR